MKYLSLALLALIATSINISTKDNTYTQNYNPEPRVKTIEELYPTLTQEQRNQWQELMEFMKQEQVVLQEKLNKFLLERGELVNTFRNHYKQPLTLSLNFKFVGQTSSTETNGDTGSSGESTSTSTADSAA